MGNYFDDAYEHTMEKLASFDLDDMKDREAYERWNSLPTRDSHIKRISQNYQDSADFSKSLAKGLGVGALASGAASIIPKARPVTIPLALGLGAGSGLAALSSLSDRSAGKAYDRGTREYRRDVNREDYMQRHGSPYAGRKGQYEAERNRDAGLLGAMILANAISDRD